MYVGVEFIAVSCSFVVKQWSLLCVKWQVYDFTAEDLIDQGEIGHGNYGTVNKMYHERSGTVMAVKVTTSCIDILSKLFVSCSCGLNVMQCIHCTIFTATDCCNCCSSELQQQLCIHYVHLLQWPCKFESVRSIGIVCVNIRDVLRDYDKINCTSRHAQLSLEPLEQSSRQRTVAQTLWIVTVVVSAMIASIITLCIRDIEVIKTWQNRLPFFEVVAGNGVQCVVSNIVQSIIGYGQLRLRLKA